MCYLLRATLCNEKLHPLLNIRGIALTYSNGEADVWSKSALREASIVPRQHPTR